MHRKVCSGFARKAWNGHCKDGEINPSDFDPRCHKTDPAGISLFIVLPVKDVDLYEPWLQSLFFGTFAAMRETSVKPEIPVLTFLDEFSSLGYQDYSATSLDNIRGAGMKLCFIVHELTAS